METPFAVTIGLDISKTEHHACTLDPARKKVFDRPPLQDEAKRGIYPGRVKTDARNAFIIANTVHTMPHALSQLRSLPIQIHLSLETSEVLIERIFSVLSEQTVITPATRVAESTHRIAAQIVELKSQRATVAQEVETMLAGFPASQVSMRTPGIDIKIAARSPRHRRRLKVHLRQPPHNLRRHAPHQTPLLPQPRRTPFQNR